MRVISGTAAGHRLEAPAGNHTRPVTDQIREALFNIWQFRIAGARFLDLFSGSGSMGIEAMSRGADDVVMIDNDRSAVNVIRKNIKACHLEDNCHEVCREDAFDSISRLHRSERKFDIIYVAPPYTVDVIFDPVMEKLGEENLLDEDGILAIRTVNTRHMQERYGELVKFREKKYGLSVVHFYQREKQEEVMNEVLKAISSRHSIKKYRPDMVPEELIDLVIEAGLKAANGMGAQSARIIAITDPEVRDELSHLNARIATGKEEVDTFYGAPVVLLVIADKNIRTHVYDGSLVMGNMLLAAHSLGLGACWIHRAKEEIEAEYGQELLKRLGIEGEWEGIGNCILGYPDMEPAEKPVRPGRVYYVREGE